MIRGLSLSVPALVVATASALIFASSASAVNFNAGFYKTTAESGTIHGVHVAIKTTNVSYTACPAFGVFRVMASNTDRSQHVQTGIMTTCDEGYSDCTDTGADHRFWEWHTDSASGCHEVGVDVGLDSTFKVIRLCASCGANDEWNMYVGGDLKQTSGTLFTNPDYIWASGNNDWWIGGCIVSSFGQSEDWERTAQSDDQTVSWTTITTAHKHLEGNWQVADLPDPFQIKVC